MEILRTPESAFVDLPDFAYEPRYRDVTAEGHPVRMAYLDEGPRAAPPVLLLHGQPTWSYLYRHVVADLVAAGLRVVAPDNIGYGRSDKPAAPTDYTVARHVGWMASLVDGLDLRDITLVAQDWGGPIGFSMLAAQPERFARVVAANTILHTAAPELAGRLTWALHAEDSRVVIEQSLVDYLLYCVRAPSLRASDFVGAATTRDLSSEELNGYDAPFPDPALTAGLRQMTALLPLTPNDEGARIAQRAMQALGEFTGPFLTCYSDGDPATRGWAEVFAGHVPGARGQAHRTLAGAGHFLQEDDPAGLAQAVIELVGT